MTLEDLELTFTPHIGNVTAQRLIGAVGSAAKIFSLRYDELTQHYAIPAKIALAITERGGLHRAISEWDYCNSQDITVIAYGDDLYPEILGGVDGRPHILYALGDASLLRGNLVAFVGSRRMSPYGVRVTNEIIEELSSTVDGLVVVSGLAMGIDATAHRAALDMQIPTIAVLPTPLPEIAPSQNKPLAREILKRGGLLLSEQPSGAKNITKTLISRNRIIVGISSGTIIVESEISGGSMRSAEIAMQMKRELGAIPGRITDAMSVGCNSLIASNSAHAITSAQDIIEMLGWQRISTISSSPSATPGCEVANLSEDQLGLLRCFRQDEPLHLDELVELTNLSAVTLQGILMILEMEGCIRTLPGARYERLISLADIG